MRVKMLVDAPGSPDGVTVNEYSQDQVYDVTHDLAAAFLANGLAVEDDADPVAPDAPVVVPEGDDAADDATKLTAGPQENK